jgi:membrane protein DedA with SNARE-associated domain
MEQWLSDFLTGHGSFLLYFLTFAMLIICSFGVPIPEEVTLLTAGFACQKLDANIWILLIVGLLGVVMGDLIPYGFGRQFGMGILQRPFFSRLIKPPTVEKVRRFFDRHGSKAVLLARFTPGLRMPSFFTAGTMGVSLKTFLFWDYLGAFVTCPAAIFLAYHYGEAARIWIAEMKFYLLIMVFSLCCFFLIRYCLNVRREKKAAQT